MHETIKFYDTVRFVLSEKFQRLNYRLSVTVRYDRVRYGTLKILDKNGLPTVSVSIQFYL